ncbi:MAG: FkbM family methyltransferase [Hyphomicrobiales bacterium]
MAAFFQAGGQPAAASIAGHFNYMGLTFPRDDSILSDKIYAAIHSGSYEREEARHLPYVLQEGERVLELGTGLGLISALCAASNLVERVLTIEANPHLIAYIKKVYDINRLGHKIELRNGVALPGPGAGSMKFYRRADFWASSLDAAPWGYEEAIDVPAIDLNTLIAEFRPSFMIVDIEGGERDLFDGSELGTTQKIMMEVHQNVIGRRGMKAVFDALSARGFHYDQWHSSHNVVTFSHIDRK